MQFVNITEVPKKKNRQTASSGLTVLTLLFLYHRKQFSLKKHTNSHPRKQHHLQEGAKFPLCERVVTPVTQSYAKFKTTHMKDYPPFHKNTSEYLRQYTSN